MPITIPDPIPRRLVERQENLFARLQPLARSVVAMGRQRAGMVVPEELRRAADALLYEVEAFRPKTMRGALPEAARHAGPLGTQLAGALEVLMGFEARHSFWDARYDQQVWAVNGALKPVRRLMPRRGSQASARLEAKVLAAEEARATHIRELRAKLVKRLEQSRLQAPPHQNA